MRGILRALPVLLVVAAAPVASDASVVIQSGATTDRATVDPTSKALRVSIYDPSGYAMHAARTPFQATALNFTAQLADTVITLLPTRSYVAGAGVTTIPVTASKRLRLVSWCITTKNAGAAVQGVQVRLRVEPAAACTTASALVAVLGAGTNIATANVVGSACASLDQGTGAIEVSGTNEICISELGTNTAGNDIALIGYEY